MNEPVKLPPEHAPDLELRQWLEYGVFGALAAGLVGIAGSLLSLARGPVEGFDYVDVLNLAALIPLIAVLGAYWTLSKAVQSPGLRRSALGLFGAWFLLDLAILNSQVEEQRWWNIVGWIALALAAFLLVVIVWKLEEIEKEVDAESAGADPEQLPDTNPAPVPEPSLLPADQTPKPSETPEGKPGHWSGWIWGALGTVVLILLKATAKFGARKGVALVAANLNPGFFGGLLLFAFFVLGALFLLWFALVKIRMRGSLGRMAAVAGALELFFLLSILIGGGAMVVDATIAVQEPGLDEKTLEAKLDALGVIWTRRGELASIFGVALWVGVTAGWFWIMRSQSEVSVGGMKTP